MRVLGKGVAYLDEYLEDIVEYARPFLIFKGLTPRDVSIIQAEARFEVDYCTPVSDLILKLEGSKSPMSNLLYSSIHNVRKVFTALKNAEDIVPLLYEKTKLSFENIASDTKKKSLKGRIVAVAKKCDDILSDYVTNDSANNFFKATQKLFDPCKLISQSSTPDQLAAPKEKIPLLSCIPTANFFILHSIFSDRDLKKLQKQTQEKRMTMTWFAILLSA
ncbi:Kinetochore-associated protein 1 [Frankliniella fusca]|uniref:Kinetochore-associated protein 1 n=1 Tax=Frankliniella fusca TaxID=407009 RepID=A0AAE1HYA8_9NEOP|nr:Kinetochore-associated protein 1 [Frankliniella fusca]